MKTSIKILLVAVMTAMLAMAASCQKDNTTSDDWKVTGARFINTNVPNPLSIGEMGYFDYQVLIVNGAAEEHWVEDTDGVATIRLSEGLGWHEYDGDRQYRCMTATKYREGTNGKDTVYLSIPSETAPGFKQYTLTVTVKKPTD